LEITVLAGAGLLAKMFAKFASKLAPAWVICSIGLSGINLPN
jgi:hypothetical protein